LEENHPPGVVEVLLRRFTDKDGNINIARKAKNGTMAKLRSSSAPEERGSLLQKAAKLCNFKFVQLLAPFADQTSLDEALGIAISIDRRQLTIIVLILQYGT
jgi:hypothetical protein